MTENGLFPAYVRYDYTSEYAPHTRTVPTLAWFFSSITGTMGSYLSHDADPIDAEAMIDALVVVMKEIDDPTTTYNLATVYTVDEATNRSIPRATKALTAVGTSAAGGVRKAVQATFNFRTAEINPFKLVFLDKPHGTGQFDKQPFSAFDADAIALVDELESTNNAWCGRDNSQIVACISATYTLNEALRKQYKMG